MNVKFRTIKFLENSTGWGFSSVWFGNEFFKYTSKTIIHKEKHIDMLNLFKLRNDPENTAGTTLGLILPYLQSISYT